MITSATRPLLLEIGCEEIPARFLTQAQMDLGDRVKAALEETRLITQELSALSLGERVARESGTGEGARQDKSPVQTFSTPRRLVAYVPAILERQADKVEEVTGPPIKVAVDATGKYTRAAESFAQKNSATVADLTRITTPKGEYLAVKKTTPGRTASEVLSEILPGVITGLGFPKSMYWTGKSGPRFVRPIRWIVALLGEGSEARVVPFEVFGVKAGNFTFGHRAMGRGAVGVEDFNDYREKLLQNHVEIDPEVRLEWVHRMRLVLPFAGDISRISKVARSLHEATGEKHPDKRLEVLRARVKALPEVSDMRVVEDKSLAEWVVNSTEWPRALLGTFEERFLKLPREILVTVMRDHQKYFAVEDAQGNLRPHFVASLNREGDPQGLIKRGHERVLTARFSDADFFWKADQKVKLAERWEKGWLERVTYQAKLGTYADKVRRMALIAKEICVTLEAQGKMTSGDTAHALRAVALCKCDLTTQMVQEFTELQGIVGGLYAKAQGEPQPVADAIYDHYLPQGAEDKCPRSMVGAVVSLADKIDSVVAAFAVGSEPTGSSDPFAIRRQSNGVVRIIIEMALPLTILPMIGWALKNLRVERSKDDTSIRAGAEDFLRDRMRYYLEEVRRLEYDTVRAVLATRLHDQPLSALQCAEGLQKIRPRAEFLRLTQAAKRIRNILTKSATVADCQDGSLDPHKLEQGPERALYDAYQGVAEIVSKRREARDYFGALESLSTLQPAVDLFFDKVLVMANDPVVRKNRLQLLRLLNDLFSASADLSEIELSSSETSIPVGASTSRGSDK